MKILLEMEESKLRDLSAAAEAQAEGFLRVAEAEDFTPETREYFQNRAAQLDQIAKEIKEKIG